MSTSVELPILRKDLKAGDNLCEYCTARCCRYFALPIDTPTNWNDFDHIRWYVMHGDCAIFVDDGAWYLMVYGDCQFLQSDHRCGIYLQRPQICREYSTDNCEYDNDGHYDRFFETADQVYEYAEATLPPRKGTDPASIPALPMLASSRP